MNKQHGVIHVCESKVYLRSDSGEQEIMDDVAFLKMMGKEIELVRIDGARKRLKDVTIDEIDFVHHKVYLKRLC